MADLTTLRDTRPSPGTRLATSALAAGVWLVAAVGAVAWASLIASTHEPWWHAVVAVPILVVPATVGALVAVRFPRNAVGWLVMVPAASTALAKLAAWYADTNGDTGLLSAAWLDAAVWGLGVPLLPLLALLFPDGRPVGRLGRSGVVAGSAGVALIVVISALAPGRLAAPSSSPGGPNPVGVAVLGPVVPAAVLIAALLVLVAAALGIVTLVARWRRGDERERVAMVMVGTPIVLALTLLAASQVLGAAGDAVAVTGAVIAAVGVPLAIGLAMSRTGLYRFDLAAADAFAYSFLAAILLVAFTGAAMLIGLLVGQGSPVSVAVGSAVAAATFAPVHGRVRRRVQLHVLGASGDPDLAAAEVARRLALVENPDEMSNAAAAAVADLLRLPGVRVLPPGAARSSPQEFRVPLHHQGIDVGALVVPGSPSASAQRALTRVAGSVSAALHAATLTDVVRRSRADLLAAVEEERRRLRRDLHDGLGPRLATLGMGLDAAANWTKGTPAEPAVAPTIARLRDQADEMLVDLRRIVSGLRPPALDELGLAEAVRLEANEVASPAGLSIDVVADPELGALPAAIEVAAYRIAIEAVLNAARHSGGRRCLVDIRNEDGLRLVVRDDGQGIRDGITGGVGLQSMRERAASVGGWVVVSGVPPHGTEVRAWLPGGPS